MGNNELCPIFREFIQQHLCGESLWFLDEVSGNQKNAYSSVEYEKNSHGKRETITRVKLAPLLAELLDSERRRSR